MISPVLASRLLRPKTPTDERTITTTEGMRVLLLGQDNPVENGIWVARRSFWVRATDFNGPRDAVNGTLVFSINGDCWQVEADDPVVIGKSAIHFRPLTRLKQIWTYSSVRYESLKPR